MQTQPDLIGTGTAQPLYPQTMTGQSKLAYQLAGAFTLILAILSIANGQFSFPLIIDCVLGIGLLQMRAGAQRWMRMRLVVGAIIWPLLFFVQETASIALLSSIFTWMFVAAITLLLTGRTTTGRVVFASLLFGCVALVSVLGLLMQ